MTMFTPLKFIGQMLTGIGIRECEHMSEMKPVEPSTHECADCKAADAKCVHLRMCMTCGYIGCCDSSSQEHMRTHVEQTGHLIARSIEGQENWLWCYPHERLIRRKI